MPTPDREALDHALHAVRLAMRVCRRVQDRLADVRAITKDDDSPVTIADLAAQGVIAFVLRERLGEFLLVGEESSRFLREPRHAAHLDACLAAAREALPALSRDDLLDAIDLGAARTPDRPVSFWTLDPIDGTKGFLRGEHYCTALARIDAGRPVLGVLGCPNLTPDPLAPPAQVHRDGPGVLLGAIDDGPRSVLLEGSGELGAPSAAMPAVPPAMRALPRIEDTSPRPARPVRFVMSVELYGNDTARAEHAMQALRAAGTPVDPPVRMDSQSKYAVLARGQGEVYLRMPTRSGRRENIWDHAPGACVARAAGLLATDSLGRPLDFGQGPTLPANAGLLTATPALHARVLTALVPG